MTTSTSRLLLNAIKPEAVNSACRERPAPTRSGRNEKMRFSASRIGPVHLRNPKTTITIAQPRPPATYPAAANWGYDPTEAISARLKKRTRVNRSNILSTRTVANTIVYGRFSCFPSTYIRTKSLDGGGKTLLQA